MIGGYAPDQPIAAGTSVRLDWSYECDQQLPSKQVSGTYTFSTSAALELDVQPPTLVQTAAGVKKSRFELPGQQGYVTVSVLPVPYAHLIRRTFEVEGQRVLAFPPSATDNSESPQLESPCPREPSPQDSCGDWWEVSLGAHVLTATTHVIGADADPPPVQLNFTTSCNEGAGDASVEQLAGHTTTVGPGDDGCSLSRGAGDASWTLALLALFWRRRRPTL